jgi:hypothetical protein
MRAKRTMTFRHRNGGWTGPLVSDRSLPPFDQRKVAEGPSSGPLYPLMSVDVWVAISLGSGATHGETMNTGALCKPRGHAVGKTDAG